MDTENVKTGILIREARKEAGLSQDQVAEHLGITRPAVGNWENGKNSPKAESLRSLAALLKKPLMYFFGIDSAVSSDLQMAPDMKGFAPILNWVQAGNWNEVCSNEIDDIDFVPMPTNCGPRTFALRVRGESMSSFYTPGAIIFVDPDASPASGDDVIAITEHHGSCEATFKRYIEEPGSGKILKALNEHWIPQYIQLTEDSRIIGVVKAQLIMR